MSIWDQHNIEGKIKEILNRQRYYKPDHHFGRPFLSVYQLTIEFVHSYPDTVKQLGYPIGGRGSGHHFSLASYLSGQLSSRIASGQITDIEGGFLSNLHLKDICFDNAGHPIHSSLTSGYDMSIFRAASPDNKNTEL